MSDTGSTAPPAKTQYYTAASLDGFIATPDGSLEWLFQFGDGSDTDLAAFMRAVGALAMGSGTYEWLLDHMGRRDDGSLAWSYTLPTWVFTSRRLETIPGADVRFVRGAVAPVHAEMLAAANGKNVWIVGGGDLAGQFHDAGLLDELVVTIASVTLGAGAPLLPRAIVTPPLRLVRVTQYGSAFAQLRYEVTPPPGERPR